MKFTAKGFMKPLCDFFIYSTLWLSGEGPMFLKNYWNGFHEIVKSDVPLQAYSRMCLMMLILCIYQCENLDGWMEKNKDTLAIDLLDLIRSSKMKLLRFVGRPAQSFFVRAQWFRTKRHVVRKAESHTCNPVYEVRNLPLGFPPISFSQAIERSHEFTEKNAGVR